MRGRPERRHQVPRPRHPRPHAPPRPRPRPAAAQPRPPRPRAGPELRQYQAGAPPPAPADRAGQHLDLDTSTQIPSTNRAHPSIPAQYYVNGRKYFLNTHVIRNSRKQ